MKDKMKNREVVKNNKVHATTVNIGANRKETVNEL